MYINIFVVFDLNNCYVISIFGRWLNFYGCWKFVLIIVKLFFWGGGEFVELVYKIFYLLYDRCIRYLLDGIILLKFG